jgi:hypothetical protein
MNDRNFDEVLEKAKKTMWETLRIVFDKNLGRHKMPNYKHLTEEMLEAYRMTGCNISLKIHFLYSHWEFFLTNIGDISNKYGERLHHNMSTMEKRFQWKWESNFAGSLKEKLQMHARGNQVEEDFEHIKCERIFSISVTWCYNKTKSTQLRTGLFSLSYV